MSALIELHNICYSIDGNEKATQILSNVNLKLNEGEVVGISGKSGIGKTTLIKIVAGLISPSSGNIIYGLDLKQRPSPIQVLFQNNQYLLNPFASIKKILIESCLVMGYKRNSDQVNILIDEVLQLLDLKHEILNKKGAELSGGERQRIGLARLLLVKPRVLILDEPFSSQDPYSQQSILNLLINLNRDKLSILCVSHLFDLLTKLTDTILILD